jgi:putative ABC transport system permease protein
MFDDLEGLTQSDIFQPAQTGRRSRLSLNWHLAWRNLTRDRIRFAITIIGVGFSVVLMALQTALLIGFALTSSSLIDRAPADFWIVPKGTRNVDQSSDITVRRRYQALATPGVASAEKMIVRFLPWKRPDGGVETVIVVGIDPNAPAVKPWNFIAGSIESLKIPGGIVIDRLYARKLGIDRVGEVVEINGHRARVVGLTSGVRAFTQAPYIFTAFKTAQTIAEMLADRTTYLLVKAKHDADLAKLRERLNRRFPELDVWKASDFSWQTREYWLLTTGAGAGLVIAAVLGLIVGIVIVAQTLYAATVERLPEYATLRAMGAGNAYLQRVILKQSSLGAVFGYGLGMAVAGTVMYLARNGSAALILPWPVILSLAVITLLMCGGGAVVSIRNLRKIDPAMVFK